MGQDPEQLRREIEETRRELGTDVDALADKVTPSKVAARRVERTKASISGVKDKVMGVASDKLPLHHSGDGSGGISSTVAGVGHSSSDLAGTAKAKATGNPLAAGVIAFGAGWLLSSLLPASDAETHAAGAIADKAQEHLGDVKEHLTDVAQQVGEQLKEPAQHAAEAVKARATDAASSVEEQATTSGPA